MNCWSRWVVERYISSMISPSQDTWKNCCLKCTSLNHKYCVSTSNLLLHIERRSYINICYILLLRHGKKDDNYAFDSTICIKLSFQHNLKNKSFLPFPTPALTYAVTIASVLIDAPKRVQCFILIPLPLDNSFRTVDFPKYCQLK